MGIFQEWWQEAYNLRKETEQQPHPWDMEPMSNPQKKAVTTQPSMKQFPILAQYLQQTQARSHSLRRQTRRWELIFRKISLHKKNKLMT